MKLSVSTEAMKELVSRASKGVGNQKGFTLTSLMAIQLKDNLLTLITTDGTNYLYVKKDKVEGDDFYIVVEADKLVKLIGKQSCETLTMTVTGNALEVKGDGVYRIDIPLDPGTGEFVQYPDPVAEFDFQEEDRTELNLTSVKAVLNTCKASLAATLEVPCYTGYYAGEKVVTTNNYILTSMAVQLFAEDVLVAPEYMDLLDVMTEEKISSWIVGNNIICATSDCIVYGKTMEEIDDFPYAQIDEYMNQEMDSKCKIAKSKILGTLDRISLFVGPYDDNVVTLTFANDGLQIESKQSNGVEVVPYLESENFTPFTCDINIKEFTDELKSYQSDAVSIQYGNDNAIKMVDGNTTFVIALIQEDEEGEE